METIQINWKKVEVTSLGGTILPKKMQYTQHSTTVGKIRFSFNTYSGKLSARIGKYLSYHGEFKSFEEAAKWVTTHYEELLKCKSMNKLIYIV